MKLSTSREKYCAALFMETLKISGLYQQSFTVIHPRFVNILLFPGAKIYFLAHLKVDKGHTYLFICKSPKYL